MSTMAPGFRRGSDQIAMPHPELVAASALSRGSVPAELSTGPKLCPWHPGQQVDYGTLARNLLAIQPVVPAASRTLRQAIPSAVSSPPTTSRTVPSGIVFRRWPRSPALARRFTPLPLVNETLTRSGVGVGSGVTTGAGIGVGTTTGATGAAAGPAAAAEEATSGRSARRGAASQETPTTTKTASASPI